MSSLSCICTADTLVKDQLKTFECYKCKRYSHMSCYSYKTKTIIKLYCIKCQLEIFEPFLELKKLMKNFQLLPLRTSLSEIYNFTLSPQDIEPIKAKKYILALICTKLSPANQNFVYECPSENFSILLNNHCITYETNSLIIADPAFLKGFPAQNVVNIDSKIGIEQVSVFGIALLEKMELKRLAKKIVLSVPLNFEENASNDEVEISKNFSIKDPISMKCLTVPARGVNCKHLACFDLMTYLSMNENPNKLRWRCPICKVQTFTSDILINARLHNIIKNLKKEFQQQNKSKKELKKISYISIDENGVAKPLKDFTEEWDKKNKFVSNNKNEMNALKPTDNNIDEVEVLEAHKVKFDATKLNIIHDFELIKKKGEAIKQIAPFIKKIEEAILLQTDDKMYMDIIDGVRELKGLENLSCYDIFEQFQTSIYLAEFAKHKSIFEERPCEDEYKGIEIHTNNLYRGFMGKIAEFMLIWAQKLDDIVRIAYLFSKIGNKLKITLSIELLLVFSLIISKQKWRKIDEAKCTSLQSVFGASLGRFLQLTNSPLDFYGKIIYMFHKCSPDLHFPGKISINDMKSAYEKLASFYDNFLDLNLKEFVKFLGEIYLPPTKAIESLDEIRLAKHFLFYFVILIQKKEKFKSNDEIFSTLSLWDRNKRMCSFVSAYKIDLSNINLEETC